MLVVRGNRVVAVVTDEMDEMDVPRVVIFRFRRNGPSWLPDRQSATRGAPERPEAPGIVARGSSTLGIVDRLPWVWHRHHLEPGRGGERSCRSTLEGVPAEQAGEGRKDPLL